MPYLVLIAEGLAYLGVSLSKHHLWLRAEARRRADRAGHSCLSVFAAVRATVAVSDTRLRCARVLRDDSAALSRHYVLINAVDSD